MSREFFKRLNKWLTRYELRGKNVADNAHRWTINIILLVLGYNIFTIFKGYNDTMLSLRVDSSYEVGRRAAAGRGRADRRGLQAATGGRQEPPAGRKPLHSTWPRLSSLIYSNLLVSYNSRESILNMRRATFAPGAPCEPLLALRLSYLLNSITP